jgi:hypothetical protein
MKVEGWKLIFQVKIFKNNNLSEVTNNITTDKENIYREDKIITNMCTSNDRAHICLKYTLLYIREKYPLK